MLKFNARISLGLSISIGLALLAAAGCQGTAAPTPTPDPPVPTNTPPPANTPVNTPTDNAPAQPVNPATAAPTAAAAPTVTAERGTDAALTGAIIYGDGAALPAGATLTVELRDVSLADAPSVVIGRQVIPAPGPSPVQYRIEYRTADLKERHDYAVSARIETAAGKLLFINDTVHPAKDRFDSVAADRVDVQLVAVE